jgi:hypothetical protein
VGVNTDKIEFYEDSDKTKENKTPKRIKTEQKESSERGDETVKI